MRIAHITSYRPVSANGVHVAAAYLASYLEQQGIDIEFWHFRRNLEIVTERLEPSGVRVVELPFPVLANRVSRGYLRRMPAVSRHWIEDRAPSIDGLHFHSVFQPESWHLARSTSLPYCLTPAGGYTMFLRPSARNRAKTLLWRRYERNVVAHAKFVHAVSPGDADTMRFLAPTVPVAVVPNGVEIPAEAPLTVPLQAPWLFIGRLDVRTKGLDLLVNGYALASRHSVLPTLIVRGPDFRGGRKELEGLVRQRGLEDHVFIGGPTAGQEKVDLLGSCGLFLHPSRNEGLPIAPLEALAFSRPVAVTPGTNLAQIVAEAGVGFVIEACTPEAVAETLENAGRCSASDLTILGCRGRALIEREFSWTHAAEEIHSLYRKYFGGG